MPTSVPCSRHFSAQFAESPQRSVANTGTVVSYCIFGVRHPCNQGATTGTNRNREHLAIALAIGLAGLAVSLWQLSLPEFLSFYDTGVYVGAAIHFVHGTLPYSQFTYVEPPGIILILSPIAALGRFIGNSGALEGARILSVVASGVNVSILAWLVRARGWIAMVISGVALSSLPVAAYVNSGAKLDLYCVTFVLMSAVAAFGNSEVDDQITRRQTIVAGLLMGAALLVKLFAF